MVDGEEKKDRGPWPFELLRRYDEVGPELGRLYEARNVNTGSSALVFFPSDRVVWQPAGPWHARIHYHPDPVCLTLDLEQAPRATEARDVVDSLVLMTAASQRVEDNPRLDAHFARRPEPKWWTSQWAVAGFAVFTLVLDVALLIKSLPDPLPPLESLLQAEPPLYSNQRAPEQAAVSYPLPAKPFRSQAVPPCITPPEEEINGGCWTETARKPPCDPSLAEHKGRCYMPVHKKDPEPQSQKP